MVDPTNRPPDRFSSADGSAAWDHSSLTGLSESFGFEAGGVVELTPGTDLGDVTVIRLLAEGGMGRVYEGRQRSPARPVAVKVLRDGLTSAAHVKRFAQEAQLLARLKHRHIAQVHMLGTFSCGAAAVPYFVLELVEEALPIDRYVCDRVPSMRQRVVLFRQAVAAVAYGHRLGVVHRDLKPGNILVGRDGEPKVIDFGVARCTDADLALTTLHGDHGGIVGTLRYMSPEQFDGDASAIDPRTDVYSLGLVLHELLAGDLPYDLRGKSLAAAARIIREQDVRVEPRLRQVVAAAAEADAEPGTLAAICERCLQKRPGDRYGSADELGADLDRWLAGEPVLARPLRGLDRVRRWLRRKWVTAATAAAVLAVVGIALAAAGLASLRAWRQEIAAERHGRAAAEHIARAGVEESYAKLRQAAEARDRGNTALARSLVAEARAASPGGPLPIELSVLSAILDDSGAVDESLAVLRGHTDRVTSVAAAAVGERIATGSEDGTARIWSRNDSGSWVESRSLEGHSAGIWAVAFSADASRLATAAADRTVCIWDPVSAARLLTLRGHAGPVYGVAFAPDGRIIATAAGDRTVRLWNAADGEQQSVLSGHGDTVFGVAFSPDGSRLATASRDRTVRLWDVVSGAQLATLTGHERRVFNVCFSHDGGRLASAAEDGTVRLWHVESRGLVSVLQHPLRVNAAAFSSDGGRLATASVDGLLRIWEPQSGREMSRLRGHTDGIWSVATLAGRGFVTGAADATARIWDADASHEPLLQCGSDVHAVAISPDGRLLATGLAEGQVRLWDRGTLREVRRLTAGTGRVNTVEFSADGTRLAAAGHDGSVRLFRVADAAPVAAIAGNGRPLYAAAFSPDGTRLATACDDSGVRVYDVADGGEIAGPLDHPRRVLGVAWSPDGEWLATACGDGVVRLWPAAGGGSPRALKGHGAAVNWVAFSPDGRLLASCSSDATVRLWDPVTGQQVAMLDGPVGQIWEIAFSPDGRRVAGVGADRRLHIWEAVSGRHLVALAGHADEVWAIAFAPDGGGVLTGSWDGTARLWGCTAADVHRRRAAEPQRLQPPVR